MMSDKLAYIELLPCALPEGQHPYVLPERHRNWPTANNLEGEEKGKPSPQIPVERTGPIIRGLALSAEDRSLATESDGHTGARQKSSQATNGLASTPGRPVHGRIDVYRDGIVSTFGDVTRLEQAEEQFRENQQQLQAINHEMQALVAERTEHVRRLHDELQQHLHSMEVQTASLKSALPAGEQALREQAQEIQETVQFAAQITQEVTVELRALLKRSN